jgi:hypothetical protein
MMNKETRPPDTPNLIGSDHGRGRRLNLFADSADAVKLGTCYVLGALALVYCFYVAATQGKEPHLQILICILGGALGWCIGMYLTPSSEGETKKFTEFGKVLLVLGAGFGIAKASDVEAFLRPVFDGGEASVSGLRLILFVSSLLIFGQATYIARLHVRGADEMRREQRTRLLAEVQKKLDELSQLQ